MYQKILVPLDGSELAECVFPNVKAFIKECRVNNIVFACVVEPTLPSFHGEFPVSMEDLEERDAARRSSAKKYLEEVANRLKPEGVEMGVEVLVGRVAESLSEYADNNDVDLIIIATHGRSGVTRWVRGSVADKILRSASVPVMMVRAPGTKGGI
ncbi:MAG: universal stress protein [Deltaproteobacteria bacterium]|nr:universal stress protein [Deltaproteobacteria bacterium]